MNLSERLKNPFPPHDVEWRIGRTGKSGRGIWASCLAYITNRAIMDRLDVVVGPENWRNHFRRANASGWLCGIAIKIDGEWVTKWDGAGETNIESLKGGLSDSMKRAAVQWGIGRYLYDLPEGYAKIVGENDKEWRNARRAQHTDKRTKEKTDFRWLPPELPRWALPVAEEDAA